MLYLVELHPAPDINAVQAILDPHTLTWYRFAPTSWLVVSQHNAAFLTQQLRPLAQAVDGYLFVARINQNDRQGWMPQAFWQWLRDHQALL